MKVLSLVVGCILTTVSASFGWGDQGHKAIWDVAQRHLTPRAKAKVNQILTGSRLAFTATWLDKARDAAKNPPTGPFKDDDETKQFNTDFPDNRTWHFVDLPEGAHSYAESDGFTGEHDVVHQINAAIKVLEGHTEAGSMSPSIALRVLVHLVGDIHQPLHCVSGFYDTHDKEHPILKQGPAAAAPVKQFEDRGGNQLFFGPQKFDELHAFFDGNLPTDAADGSGSFRELADIIDEMLANEDASTAGDIHGWAQKWADESLSLANAAYSKLTFGHTELNSGNSNTRIKSIAITLPDSFEDEETDVVSHQLAKAAARLAEVLNRVLDSH